MSHALFKPRASWSPTPDSKRARLGPSSETSLLSPHHRLSIESDAELGAAYLEDDALSLIEDRTSEECAHSPRSAMPESCPGLPESSPHSGSWDLISLPPAGLSFTPASHPGESVSSTQLSSPLRPPKARARMPVQAPHHISQLLRPRNAWPAREELPPRSGPAHGAPCPPTGGLPAYCKRFHMALPTAQPKPAPIPRPPPLSTSLNRPAPLHQTPPLQTSTEAVPSHAFSKAAASRPPSTQQRLPARPSLVTRRLQDDERRTACGRAWLQLLAFIGSFSQLWEETSLSLTPDKHRLRAIAKYAPSSLEAYLSACTQFVAFLQAQDISLDTLTLARLADFLDAALESRAQDRDVCRVSPKTMLRALSWLARTAQMEALLGMVSNAIIQAFAWDCPPRDRKEALPLPMACVVAWEEIVCSHGTARTPRL